jgi:hypothetical protein
VLQGILGGCRLGASGAVCELMQLPLGLILGTQSSIVIHGPSESCSAACDVVYACLR